MSEESFVKIAFLGCGGIATSHLSGIRSHADQLQVTAVIDRDSSSAAHMAEQTGALAFSSLEEALDQGDFEAVDIMLPHHVHEQATVQAFEAGKHVLLEKPMATTLDSCERIMAAARKAGTVFMVAEQAQYRPDLVRVQQLIEEGAIGEVITARAAFGSGSNWGPKPWRYDNSISGGGICIDGGSHWIRALRMWLGEIEQVVAVLGYPLEAMEGESLAHAIFRFQSGKFAAYEALRDGIVSVPGKEPRIEEFRVNGTEGVIVIEKGQGSRALIYDQDHREGRNILTEGLAREDAFGLELADFASAVLNGTELAAGPEVSLGELRTVLAMYRSDESGQWEKIWD